MFLLLSRNNPYLEELNGNPNNQMAHKDLEGIEIDLKNRFKDQEKNIKLHHFQDNTFESQDELISEDDDSNENSSQNNSSSLISLNSDNKMKKMNKENNINSMNKEDQEKLIKLEKLNNFKNLIKLFDLLGTIIVILTHVASQFEDDEYYRHNKEIRISGSLIVNYLNQQSANTTWNEVFDDKRINLRKLFHYCLDNENETTHTKYPKKIADYMNKTKIKDFHNLTNLQILEANNISRETFNFGQGNLVYSDFQMTLEVSKLSNNLRIIILVLSIVVFFLYFISWYLQYYKEEKLENELISLNKEPTTDNDETKNDNIVSNVNNIQKEKRFYNSLYFFYVLLDFIFLAILPYPNETYKITIKQFGNIIIYPVSAFLNAFLSFRVFYLLKLLNVYSLYRIPKHEKILAKNSIKPDFIFNIKAYQRKYPFASLVIIFILTVYTFGLFVRYFEMYFWEGIIIQRQLWHYRWNAFWCLFISMTTVAFGDFYPKTHVGRVLIIFSTIVGIYFVSMTMKYITQKSILTDMEQKAYKLITRLRHRSQLKDVNANIIYHSLKMIQLKKKLKKKQFNNPKDFDLEFNSEKKEILEQIEEYKIFNEKLKTCDKVQTKDQLIDILEQIEKNIYDIETELDILEKMNISFSGYKNTQQLMIKFLKKSILNTQFIYEILQRNPKIFGVLGIDMNNVEKDKHKLQQQIDNLYTNYQEAGNAESEKKDNENDTNLNAERKSLSPLIAMHGRNNKGKNNLYAINNNNERNNQGMKKDLFNWEKFFTPATVVNTGTHKPKKNKRLSNASDISKFRKLNESGISASSTVIGNGRKVLTEDLYSRELQKYTVEQSDFSNYFYSVFFEKNNNNDNHSKGNENIIQNVIMRNSPKTLASVKVMKSIKNKIDSIMKQKNRNVSENSSFNSMTELKDEDNVD